VRDESAPGTKKECSFFNGHVLRWATSRFADKCAVDRYAPAALIYLAVVVFSIFENACRSTVARFTPPWTKISRAAASEKRDTFGQIN